MHVVALLDKPSPESFGMVAFVAAGTGGSLTTFGLAEGPGGVPISPHVLLSLIHGGHALDVSRSGAMAEEWRQPAAAGWLGRRFEERAAAVGLPPRRAPVAQFFAGDRGSFWICSAYGIHRQLDDWTARAASRVFRECSEEIADLMAWTLPDRIETQAAVWWTRKTQEERDRHVALHAGMARGGEGRAAVAARLVEAYTDVGRRYENIDPL